ncbi:MAG TPA: hypothetical protein VI818_05515 [Candidatus Thermoplasmatota archaeon]|nr:hypothetical protein [Candidatus Thermoplasmatota archaeon]
MDLESFTKRVAVVLEDVREALALVEEAAQSDDDSGWLDLSRGYALLVAPMREYLTGAERARPLPRQLAKKIGELRSGLLPHEERIALLALHPDLSDLEALRRDAERVA